MSSVNDLINHKLKGIKDLQLEIQKLEKLLKTYPDLRIHKELNYEVLCSKSVNNEVDNYSFKGSCGCCGVSPTHVWIYFKNKDGDLIYADPPLFHVKNNSIFEATDPINWEEKMINGGISNTLIEKIKSSLK
jgi:hypothetical protein